MTIVKFTSALKRFFPTLTSLEVEGKTVDEVMSNLEKEMPGLSDYILEEDGSLREHVNIFIGDNLIQDRRRLSDQVNSKDEILIYQALSGG